MTEKSTPSLNLIERMAQRMAKEGSAAAPLQKNGAAPASVGTQSVSFSEPPVARAEPTVARVEPSVARAEPIAPPRSVAAPAMVAAPASVAAPSEQRAPRLDVEKSREVNLDFRVLRQNGMITPDNMASAISNEFRAVKRKLLQKARDPNSRATVNNLVMVTSSLPGEGKTFTATNLAISLAAERGMQVLLIDADVIRPSIGNVFKSTPREGLLDLLTGKASRVADVMCRCSEIPNLAVIFAGSAHVNSPELIASARMADFCKDISSRYPDRMIIIDSPPVLASPEPATLASYVHQLIMVVAADSTDRHQLRKSLESVASCKNVSLLFNKAPRWNEAEYAPYYGYASTATQPPVASS